MRGRRKITIELCCALLMASLSLGGCGALRSRKPPVDLATLQSWTIVVAEDASPSEQYAAEELQRLYEQASKCKIPIASSAEQGAGRILVGPGAASAATTCDVSGEEYGPEDLRIVANPGEIVITGGRPRGTLYGVYTFCEKALGVRFLTADHTHVPAIPDMAPLKACDIRYSPRLKWRWAYYGEIHADNAFAVRLRQNTRTSDPRLGGRSPRRLINHTVSGLLPWSTYGKEHPEYFCMRDGKRPTELNLPQTHQMQPCFSNPDARRIMLENVMKRIEGGYPQCKDFSVSQGDNLAFCTCPACAAKDAAAGCHTGQLLEYVNFVAEQAEKRYPDVTIGTLIYQWTRKPPKNMRPRHNVKLQLCSIECCQIHAIDDPKCPLNKPFQEDLAGWAKLSENIAIWNYNVNFVNYLVPCPNLFNLDRNVRYFVDNNVQGIFMQCAGGTTGGEFSDLRNYIICNLLWDPSRDGEELMNEFLELHYGAAALPIRRFIDRVHAEARASGLHHDCFGLAGQYGLTGKTGRQGVKDFEEALSLAENDVIRNRVEKASIAAWRLALAPMDEAIAEGRMLTEAQRAELRPVAKTLFDLCRKHKVSRFAERTSIEDAARAVAAMLDDDSGIAVGDDPLRPLGDAAQSILELYQKPDAPFSLALDLTVATSDGAEGKGRVEIVRVSPEAFRFLVNYGDDSIVLQRTPEACFIHLPARGRLVIGDGPLPAGATPFTLDAVLAEMGKQNSQIAMGARMVKGMTGRAALLIPRSAGIPVSAGQTKDGKQDFTLKSGGHDRIKLTVDRATGRFDRVVYMDSRATVTAELTLAHTASLPPAPASAKTRMTVSRPNLEAALVRETCGLLNTRGSLPPDHPLRAAIEGKGFMEGIADYLTEKAAPAL